jgi:hypothetical protein
MEGPSQRVTSHHRNSSAENGSNPQDDRPITAVTFNLPEIRIPSHVPSHLNLNSGFNNLRASPAMHIVYGMAGGPWTAERDHPPV